MTLIQDQLRNATFRGVNFLVKSSSISFAQKTVVHEYPNSDRVEVQFLGESPESFSLEMIIKGAGDQYFRDRNALKAALLNPSIGKLIHPYEGELNCAVIGRPLLREGDRESGVARFSAEFIRVDEKLFPTKTADNSDKVVTLRRAVEDAIGKYIGETFGISYSGTYELTKFNLFSLTSLYTDITNSLAIANDKITDVKKTINDFNNNILKYLSGEDDIAVGLLGLYNSLTDIGQTPTDQINLWLDTFDNIPDNPVYQISTAPRQEILSNSDVINTGAKAMTLANLYNFTPEITFVSVDEIDGYRVQLETRYKKLTEIDTAIPSDYLSITGLVDPDLAYNLSLLRAQVQKYLDGLENTVGEVVTVENAQPTNLTAFVYNYYGNLDNYNKVKELNNIKDPTQISGSLQIII
jgi:prophage DNA circulation protein